MKIKQRIQKEVKFATRVVFGAALFISVAATGMWALAVFTEPTDTPSNSVQDWAKNIMGANNSDNAFDSSAVTANRDGSIVERLEDLKNSDYVACVNVYSPDSSSAANRPDCPVGFDSVSDGYHYNRYSSGNLYLGWRACCLPM